MGNGLAKPQAEAPPPYTAKEENRAIDAIKMKQQQPELGFLLVVRQHPNLGIVQIPITPGMDDDILFDEIRYARKGWEETSHWSEQSNHHLINVRFRFASVRIDLPRAIREKSLYKTTR